MRITLILLFPLLLLTACIPGKIVKKNISDISYRELLVQNDLWQKNIASMEGNARITLDTPEYSGNFTADVLLDGSDSLLITITGPMGMRVGKVFVAGSRFVFYNQIMNQFMTGNQQDFEGINFLQFPMELSQLRNVFAAQDEFGILKKEKYEIRDDAFYVETVNGSLSYHIWFDRSHLKIKKIEYYEGEQLLYFKEYERFKKVNDVWFPHLINFIRPDEKQGLTIYFSDLQVNTPINKSRFAVHISDNAKQIDLSLESE